MNKRRRPAKPPDLSGFTYLSLLGSGGYSDVFLYEQEMPRRSVAVKVLLDEVVDEDVRRQFTAEANVMARLSTHPYIVTILQAGVADDGRAYLIMEYYPRPNLSVRAHTEKLSVAEVLRIGIQVASAVETAHRAGILHRDIKPANILTSDYGRPGLTDFGIAGTIADDDAAASGGLSIPWSPPEVVSGDGRADSRADVYSLGATVYTLLAGHSPFEHSGQSNSALDLIARIEHSPPPVTGRADVPASLDRFLQQAMAKNAANRPESVAVFARGLQAIEQELHLAVTPLDVVDDRVSHLGRTVDIDAGETRLKNPQRVDAQPTDVHSELRGTSVGVPSTIENIAKRAAMISVDADLIRPEPVDIPCGRELVSGVLIASVPEAAPESPVVSVRDRQGLPDAPAVDETMLREFHNRPLNSGSDAADSRKSHRVRRGRRKQFIVAVVAVALVVAVVGYIWDRASSPPPPPISTTLAPGTTESLESLPPTPTNLSIVRAGNGDVQAAWENPSPESGDKYLWRRTDVAQSQSQVASDTRITITGIPAQDKPCIEVSLRRSTGELSLTPAHACVAK